MATANFGHYVPDPAPAFTILSDGSVDPPTAPIQRKGEIYSLTDDIHGYCIVIKRDNVTLDGAGYKLQGNGTSTGVFIRTGNNVTIIQMEIDYYKNGIYLRENCVGIEIVGNIINATRMGIVMQASSSHAYIHGNTITQSNEGICVSTTGFNSIVGNTITLCNDGIHVGTRGFNSIVGNTITGSTEFGINLGETEGNLISENYIAENYVGIALKESYNNTIIRNTIKENTNWAIQFDRHIKNKVNIIYHNYFIDNRVGKDGLQVSIPGTYLGLDSWALGAPNIWDDGEKGNYWSDYLTRYNNATEIGNTGIGDTPFYINVNNKDNFPIMEHNVIPEFPTWTPMLLLLTVLAVATLIYKRRLHRSISSGDWRRNCSKTEGG